MPVSTTAASKNVLGVPKRCERLPPISAPVLWPSPPYMPFKNPSCFWWLVVGGVGGCGWGWMGGGGRGKKAA
jgi:hypothetical protein